MAPARDVERFYERAGAPAENTKRSKNPHDALKKIAPFKQRHSRKALVQITRPEKESLRTIKWQLLPTNLKEAKLPPIILSKPEGRSHAA